MSRSTTATLGQLYLDTAIENGTLVNAGSGVRCSLEERETSKGAYLALIIWSNKSVRPVYHYKVRNLAQAYKAVIDQVASNQATLVRKAEYAAEKKAKAAAARAVVKVGTIFYNSWGYDQTQVDYYEVTRVSPTGATVWVRELCAETVEGRHDRVKPSPGNFSSAKETKHRLGAYGIKVGHHTASICSPEATHYRTSNHCLR